MPIINNKSFSAFYLSFKVFRQHLRQPVLVRTLVLLLDLRRFCVYSFSLENSFYKAFWCEVQWSDFELEKQAIVHILYTPMNKSRWMHLSYNICKIPRGAGKFRTLDRYRNISLMQGILFYLEIWIASQRFTSKYRIND